MLSKNSSEVTDALRENLFSILWAVKPLLSVSIRKPLIPSSVIAQIKAKSAIEPLVIHILEPLIIQSSPSCLAWVFMFMGSDPPWDSVNPKHPIASAFASLGNQWSFCSSLPYLKMGNITRLLCTEAKLLSPLSPRSNSLQIKPKLMAFMPAHP